MKVANIIVLGLLFNLSPVVAQTIGDLSEDQRIGLDRKKLIVKRVAESTGVKGLYWRLLSKNTDAWYVFEGPDNRIEYEEFFHITGYDEEAERAKMNLEESYRKCGIGGVFIIAGIAGMCSPKIETYIEYYDYHPKWGPMQQRVKKKITHPALIPGAVLTVLGSVIWYQGGREKLHSGIPYQTAIDIANEYNSRLINEMVNQPILLP